MSDALNVQPCYVYTHIYLPTSPYRFITDIGINLVISHSAMGVVSGRFEPHILAGSI
jgi:hypothetical protein